jgi:predicted ATPase
MHSTTPQGSEPPVDLTSFVGRVRELAALRNLAQAARLITLTGAGGSGKSRLARQLLPHLGVGPGTAVWVELAPILDPAMVPAVTLRAVDPSAEPGGAPQELLQELLRTRRTLLVLDNCEHLVDACAAMVDALLRACPDLSILATSREALGVPGERAWLVPAMEVPGGNAGAVRVADSDAARLFADRARDVAPDFEITDQNAAAVADICRRLDGIPLAIELAASRVRVMTPEQIRDRLGDAFSLLTSRARTALPRHRTLRAALDWSHDLLPAEARAVFRRLSVFRSGFTLDAAEAVAAGGGIESGDVLDLVAMLVDRSLLTMREHGDSARYHLLETTRQYARQKLAEAGEEDQARRAMAAFCVALVAEVEPDFTTTRRRHAFARLDPEIDNIREVLDWTHANDAAAHVRLTGMMWWYWYTSRHWLEARKWLDGALALSAAGGPSRDRAAVLFASGALSSLQAQVQQARGDLEQAVAMAAGSGDARLEAYALNYLGMVYGQVGDPAGAEFSGRAESWFRANDDAYGLRLALLLRGMGAAATGDRARARTFIEEAVSIARRFGQDRELGIALQTLAGVVLDLGDEAGAERLVAESLDALRRDWSYLFLGRGCDLLAISIRNKDPLQAARLIGAGHALRDLVGAKRFHLDELRMQPITQQLQERLGEQYGVCFADGASRPHELVQAAAVSQAEAVAADAMGAADAVSAARACAWTRRASRGDAVAVERAGGPVGAPARRSQRACWRRGSGTMAICEAEGTARVPAGASPGAHATGDRSGALAGRHTGAGPQQLPRDHAPPAQDAGPCGLGGHRRRALSDLSGYLGGMRCDGVRTAGAPCGPRG